MRIVNVCRRFDAAHWGGTETVVAETGARLLRRGHQVSVLASSALAAPGRCEIAGLPVERHTYGYPYLGLSAAARAALDNAGGNLISWSLLARLLTMPRPDIVHLHTAGRLGAMVRWACRARGLPYLVSLHGGHYTLPPGQRARFRDPLAGTVDLGKPLGLMFGARRVLADAAAVLAFSRAEAEACRRALPGDVRVLHAPHGLDLERWRGPAPAGVPGPFAPGAWPRLLCVGRVDPQKGQDLLLPALRRLRARHPRVQLVLVGSATDRNFAALLEQRVREEGLEASVVRVGGLAPTSPALRAAYRDATCLLVPSRHEPFGIVVLEGWASQVPVVATRTGGLHDLLGDGEAGWLVPPEDPLALAHAVEELLDDPEGASARVRAGAARVAAEHDWDRTTERLEGLYGELAPDRGRGRAQGRCTVSLAARVSAASRA